MSSTGPFPVPESVSLNSVERANIPHCHKGMSWEEVKNFIAQEMALFHKLEDMSDLNCLYQAGKQLSRLYFDMPGYRMEASELLVEAQFPLYSTKMMKKLNNMGVFKNDDIWFSSFYFYNVNWNFSDCNPSFASALGHAGLPHLLILNIGHQPYLDNLASKNVYYLIKASLSIMHNISRILDNAIFFSTESVKQSLIQLSQRDEEFIRCVSTLTLGHIVTDNEPEDIIMALSPHLVKSIIKFLEKAMASEKRRYSGFTMDELLSALLAFSMNDTLNASLVDTSCLTILKSLSNNCKHQSELDKVTRVLWNLLFNTINRQSLLEQHEIKLFLTNLRERDGLSQRIEENLDAALWLLTNNDLSTNNNNGIINTNNNNITTTTTISPPHQPINSSRLVYLSYSQSNADFAFVLRQKLEERGIPCLSNANTDDLAAGGMEPLTTTTTTAATETTTTIQSQLQTTMDHVKTAQIFLACLSQAYKHSSRCRMEVEIASRCNKELLVVLLQSKYQPDGWPAKLCESRTLHDLSDRKELDVALDQLIGDLDKLYPIVVPVEIINETANSVLDTIANTVDEMKDNATTTTTTTSVFPPPDYNSVIVNNNINNNQDDNALVNNDDYVINNHVDATIIMKEGNSLKPSVVCSPEHMVSNAIPALIASYTAAAAAAAAATATSTSSAAATATIPTIPSFVIKTPLVLDPRILEWTTDDVKDWLISQQLGHVTHEFKGVNGALLGQLLQLRRESPEFFYHALDTKLRLSMLDILKFCHGFENLINMSGN